MTKEEISKYFLENKEFGYEGWYEIVELIPFGEVHIDSDSDKPVFDLIKEHEPKETVYDRSFRMFIERQDSELMVISIGILYETGKETKGGYIANVSDYVNNLKRRVELANSMYENALDTIENTEDINGIEGLLDYINSRLEELKTLTNIAFTLSEVNWTGASAVVSWEELLDILYKLNIKFWT